MPATRASGSPNWTGEALNEAVIAADREGLQAWLHAIGDLGVRMALDAHEAALRANGRLERRGRIEHLETIQASDYARFKPLGVIASMQPLHANPDQNALSVWAGNLGRRARFPRLELGCLREGGCQARLRQRLARGHP